MDSVFWRRATRAAVMMLVALLVAALCLPAAALAGDGPDGSRLSPQAAAYKKTVTIKKGKATSLALFSDSATQRTSKLKVSGAKASKVKWSSSKKKVVSVAAKTGKVTARKPGKAKITATYGKRKYKCAITVKKVAINVRSANLNVGDTLALSLKGDAVAAAASSNPSVASVTASGVVTGVSAGTATVTLKSRKGTSYSCEVTVSAPAATPDAIVPVTGVSFARSELNLTVGGDPVRNPALVEPANATNKAVTYESKDAGIAAVDFAGTVTPVAPGETTILATTSDGGKVATCKVVVAASVPSDGTGDQGGNQGGNPGGSQGGSDQSGDNPDDDQGGSTGGDNQGNGDQGDGTDQGSGNQGNNDQGDNNQGDGQDNTNQGGNDNQGNNQGNNPGNNQGNTDQGDVVATSVAQLQGFLKDGKNYNSITLDTDEEGPATLEKPAKDMTGTELVVKAPKATIENYVKYKGVTIESISGDTYREHADNNITVKADKSHVIVEPEAHASVTAAASVSEMRLENNGSIELITVETTGKVVIGGDGTQFRIRTEVKVPATVDASVALEVIAQVKATLILRPGSTGTTAEATNESNLPAVEGVGTVDATVKGESGAVVDSAVLVAAYSESVANALQDSVSVSGNVADTEGSPAEGAKVELLRYAGDSNAPDTSAMSVGSATTDSEGGFSFQEVKPGNYIVVVSHDGMATVAQNVYVRNADADVICSPITLLSNDQQEGVGGISGKVVYNDGEQDAVGIAGITLRVRVGSNSLAGTVERSVVTGEDGRYTISGLKPGIYTIEALDLRNAEVAYRQAYCDVVVVADDSCEVDIEMTKAGEPEVRISKSAAKLAVGHDLTLSAAASDGSKITWLSKGSTVATVVELEVAGKARVTGHKEGTATITATTESGAVAECEVTVVFVPVKSVKIDPEIVQLNGIGSTAILEAVFEPADATNRNVEWESSNKAVVTVDSDGKLTAVGEGTATITVTTEDGDKTATVSVAVKKDADDSMNSIEMSVANSLDDDYRNVVLVGTDALVEAKVTKDGVSYSGPVTYKIEGVAGYSDYYEVKSFPDRSTSDGVVTFYIGLKDEYSKREPVLGDAESWATDAAYATVKITLIAGGATESKDINVSFAQLMASTVYNDDAIVSVANGRDSSVDDLSTVEWEGNPIAASTTYRDGYVEEYVVEQQVSDASEEHPVVLDAAPLLLLPSSNDGAANGAYTADLDGVGNLDVGSYGNYAGVEDACVIKGVPGYMEYLGLTFSRLKLSGYSRLVVRAYVANTDYPISGAEMVISPGIQINESSASRIIQVSDLFKATNHYPEVDLKLFVESAGQVIDDPEIGYTLTAASGRWADQAVRPLTMERLQDCVSWSVDSDDGYTAEEAMSADEASQFLGSRFIPSYCYYKSLPRYPRVGNAIIRGYRSASRVDGDLEEIYLYPTTSDKESSTNKLEFISGCYAFPASTNQVRALAGNADAKWTHEADSSNRYVIDSSSSGYVQATAHVDAYGVMEYDAHTSVQFANPGVVADEVRPLDYYALTGQTIELTAEVTSSNEDPEEGAIVTWSGLAGATKASNMTIADDEDIVEGATDQYGKTTLRLSASEAHDLSVVQAECENFNVKLSIAGEEVETGAASLHWVMPGLYYKGDVEGAECCTSEVGEVTAATTQYRAGESWRIGTKVVGVGNRPVSAEHGELKVEAIDNVAVSFGSVNEGADMKFMSAPSNGVAVVRASSVGNAYVTVSLGGLVDQQEPCSITFSYAEVDVSGRTTVHKLPVKSVGEGTPINAGGTLRLPIQWLNSDIQSIDFDYNEFFNIRNDIDPIVVYARVTDAQGNGVKSVHVNPKITDETGNEIEIANLDSMTTDDNGYVAIEFEKPSAATVYTLTASVVGGISATPATMRFTDEQSTFTDLSITPSDDLRTIMVKFNENLSQGDVSKQWFKELFTVYDDEDELDIVGVVPGSSANELIISLNSDFQAVDTPEVVISDRFEDPYSGVTHYLLSDRGVLYANRQQWQAELEEAQEALAAAQELQERYDAEAESASQAYSDASERAEEKQAAYEAAKTAHYSSADFWTDRAAAGGSDVADAQSALSALENATYADSTDTSSSADATDADNVLVTFQLMKDCNKIRESLGLATLKVTHKLMAQSQSNTNWSRDNMKHSGQWNDVAENLSWGYGNEPYDMNVEVITTNNPFEGWYDKEKQYWEANKTDDWEQKLSEGTYEFYVAYPSDFSKVGHYLNVINKDSRLTGFSYAKGGGYGTAYGQVFRSSLYAGEQSYTVDQYEELFKSWLDEKRSATNEKAALDEALLAVDEAKSKNDEAAQNAAEAAEAVSAAQKRVEQLEKELAALA